VFGFSAAAHRQTTTSPLHNHTCMLLAALPANFQIPVCSCSRPRGFGFIEFKDSRDAEDALYHLDRTTFMGREISVSTRAQGLTLSSMIKKHE
jgi:hypothetical protein